jgi:hypothetical protein
MCIKEKAAPRRTAGVIYLTAPGPTGGAALAE